MPRFARISRLAIAPLWVALSGCSSSPSEFDRLTVGTAAVVHDKEKSDPFLILPDGDIKPVPDGIRVTISSDESKEGPKDNPFRPVQVIIESGQYQGKNGTMIRKHLTPRR